MSNGERIYDWPTDIGFPEHDVVLVIRMPDREPGPARWDLDIEEALDKIGQRYFVRLQWVARDNQEAVVESTGDLRTRRPSSVLTDFSPLVGEIRDLVDSRVNSRTSVTAPLYMDISRSFGPAMRSDSWLIPMVIPDDLSDKHLAELTSIILNTEDFRAEDLARDARLAYGWNDTGTGTWEVDQRTRDTFLTRVIEFVRDPDHVLQRNAIFATSSGIPGGVVAQRGIMVVMLVDGGSLDAAELLEAAAPHIVYGAAEQHQDIEDRLGPHPNRGALARNLFWVWSGRDLRGLVGGRTPDTLGSRIELLQAEHLRTLDRREQRKAEEVGHGRYLLRR